MEIKINETPWRSPPDLSARYKCYMAFVPELNKSFYVSSAITFKEEVENREAGTMDEFLQCKREMAILSLNELIKERLEEFHGDRR